MTVPVSCNSNTVLVTAAVNGNTATVSKPATAQLAQVIDEGVKAGSVKIDMSGMNKDIDTVSVPIESLRAIEPAVRDSSKDSSVLAFKPSDGAVTFDAKGISAITEQAKGSYLRLKLERIGESNLNKGMRVAAKSMDTQNIINAYIVPSSEWISDFLGGSATMMVANILIDGQKSSGVVVWFLSDNGSKDRSTFDQQREGSQLHSNSLFQLRNRL